jgi:hypothetical protein
MKNKKPRVRMPRRVTVPFEKHANLPPAIVDGKFVAQPGTYVWAFRHRAGCKPSWHRCKVMRVDDKVIETWDETLSQWFMLSADLTGAPELRIAS